MRNGRVSGLFAFCDNEGVSAETTTRASESQLEKTRVCPAGERGYGWCLKVDEATDHSESILLCTLDLALTTGLDRKMSAKMWKKK